MDVLVLMVEITALVAFLFGYRFWHRGRSVLALVLVLCTGYDAAVAVSGEVWFYWALFIYWSVYFTFTEKEAASEQKAT